MINEIIYDNTLVINNHIGMYLNITNVCLILFYYENAVLPSVSLHLRIQFWQVIPLGSLTLNNISVDGVTGTSTLFVSGIYN